MISSVVKKIIINTKFGNVTIQLFSNGEVIYITPNAINGERLMEYQFESLGPSLRIVVLVFLGCVLFVGADLWDLAPFVERDPLLKRVLTTVSYVSSLGLIAWGLFLAGRARYSFQLEQDKFMVWRRTIFRHEVVQYPLIPSPPANPPGASGERPRAERAESWLGEAS